MAAARGRLQPAREYGGPGLQCTRPREPLAERHVPALPRGRRGCVPVSPGGGRSRRLRHSRPRLLGEAGRGRGERRSRARPRGPPPARPGVSLARGAPPGSPPAPEVGLGLVLVLLEEAEERLREEQVRRPAPWEVT